MWETDVVGQYRKIMERNIGDKRVEKVCCGGIVSAVPVLNLQYLV